MWYTHKTRLPYSEEGLKLLQKTLKLYAGLVKPVIRLDSLTQSMAVRTLGAKTNSRKDT